jgi:hypothetical protein
MESEEGKDSDSIEVQLVRFDYENYSSKGRTGELSHNGANSANDNQSGTGDPGKNELTTVILD